MYMEHTGADYRDYLDLPADYMVEGVLIYGTWDLDAESNQLPLLRDALENTGRAFTLTRFTHRGIGHAYEFQVEGKNYWFVPVMGTAVLAQYLHIACLLGSKRNILLGIVGGLAPGMRTGDLILPTASTGNDNARYYDRTNPGIYEPDPLLRAALHANLTSEVNHKVWEGNTTTCEMMFAETALDVASWSANGYLGVEMEGALTFAMSRHFSIPSAALFYVADNLIEAETMLHENYANHDELHLAVRREQYRAALATLLAIPETLG